MTSNPVKIGIVGIGNMGATHVGHVIDLPCTELVAVCDRRPARLDADEVPLEIPRYADFTQMLAEAEMDGVIIATPHYDHPDMTLAAFERGIHVLVEKPIAVHVAEAQRMIDGYHAAKTKQPDLVFAAMFMQRTWGQWRKIKAMIDGCELGRLIRCSWIITDWFRAQSYYDSGDWRASWAGEGGGVLMNQAPHNLDLFQWLVGMPARVHGFVSFGKHHRIEVEDEVTAYLEYDNGMVGHFITTTGESPGSNRLEIVGELGKLVFDAPLKSLAEPDPVAAAADGVDAADDADNDAETKPTDEDPDAEQLDAPPEDEMAREKEPSNLTFARNHWSSIEQIQESAAGFEKVPCVQEVVDYPPRDGHGHEVIIANFADAILTGADLIAPASEGLNSVMLNNAIILSAHRRGPVELPIDGGEFAAVLAEYIADPPAPDHT